MVPESFKRLVKYVHKQEKMEKAKAAKMRTEAALKTKRRGEMISAQSGRRAHGRAVCEAKAAVPR